MTMPVDETDPRLVFVSLDKATVPPPGLIEHLKDRWWVTTDRGVLFWKPDKKRDYMAPQCNSDETCARMTQQRMYPWASLTFLPSVFRRINPRDY